MFYFAFRLIGSGRYRTSETYRSPRLFFSRDVFIEEMVFVLQCPMFWILLITSLWCRLTYSPVSCVSCKLVGFTLSVHIYVSFLF